MNENKLIGKVAKRVQELKSIKARKDAGEIFCLPFESYPKLASFVPGIVPGMIQMVTAASGIGKTQVTKAFYVRQPLEYAMKHNINLKIFYFALEESEQEFIDSMICNFISARCDVRMDLLMLQGYREKSLSQDMMDLIDLHIDDVERLLENVEIIDSVYNPTGIYKYCRDYADKNGTHHFEEREFIKNKIDDDGKTFTIKEKKQVYSHYVPNDPLAFTIVIVDHIGLLTQEKDKDTNIMLSPHQTIAKWSTDYALKQITKHWNWAVVNVIQQEQSQEREQFTNTGLSIQKKTEPTAAGFANNKEIQRDAKVIIGVGSPDRYGFEEYHGYDIRRFRDTFRYIKILKNRFGAPNKYVHYLFDGATNRLVELPKSTEVDKMVAFENAADILLGRVGKPRDKQVFENKPVTKNFGQKI